MKFAPRIVFLVLLFALGGATVFVSGCRRDSGGKKAAGVSAKFHCPMHPTYTSDRPGDCPICGMRLVAIEAPVSHGEAAPTPEATLYRCPMHPDVQSDKPAKCPVCGMDLEPVKKVPEASSAVPGQAPVQLPPGRAQTIGVRVEPVILRDLASVIRASARVAYDPELFSAITEYKEAIATRDKIQESTWPDVHERAGALIRASKLRLRQLGLSDQQINRVAKAEGDSTNLLLGQPGGSVWVYAQIYEYELPRVRQGQRAEISASAFPGKTFKGTVRSVSTILNPESRTARVLIDVPDPDGSLRPEMYVDAAIYVPLGRQLAIPSEAIMDTGTRQLVFVESAPSTFEPRDVRVGPLAQGYRPVLSGIKEGEKVVVSGNFLIDSESKLKAALSQPESHSH